MNRIDPTGMDSFYNWERESYKDERRDEVSWMILRLSFNRIGHSESHDVPPTSKDVDAVTGATPKVDPSLVVPIEKANVAPSIPLSGIIWIYYKQDCSKCFRSFRCYSNHFAGEY